MSHLDPQDLYDQILTHMPIACVDIAIVANGAVLLVKRKGAPAEGQWWLPGGRVIKGERMRDTALRKAREEVGLVCHVGPIIHTDETIFPDGPRGIPVHSINICFILYPVDAISPTRVSLDSHHEEWQWVKCIPTDVHRYVVKCLQASGLE